MSLLFTLQKYCFFLNYARLGGILCKKAPQWENCDAFEISGMLY